MALLASTPSDAGLNLCLEKFGLNARLLRPPKPMMRIHHHQEIEINYLVSGGVTYLHRWRPRSLHLRRVTIFWGATPHRLVSVEPGSVLAWITIPVAWVRQWNFAAALLERLMEGEWLAERRDDTAPERYPVLSWVEELEHRPQATHEALLLELQACFMRLSQQTVRERAEAKPSSLFPGSWNQVEAMARFIAANFPQPISAVDVAKSARLNPKYAMTLFRRVTGTTIRRYLEQHRVTHAQRLLLSGSDKIVDVALASGYTSLSAFYSAFTSETRQSPRAFRRRHLLPGTGGKSRQRD